MNRMLLYSIGALAIAGTIGTTSQADEFIEPHRGNKPKKSTGRRINDPPTISKPKSASLKKLLSRKARP